jgi:hypothetical protein
MDLYAYFKRNYRLGVPGAMSPKIKVEYALRLLTVRHLFEDHGAKIPSKLSYRAIAKEVGVRSGDTIMRWDHKDIGSDSCSCENERWMEKEV